jgi:transposase
MMGKPSGREAKLFYYDLCLEERVPADHLLRQIRLRVDFDFVSELVQDRYGVNGHVSVPPPVILKLLLLLLFLYDVASERELMRALPYRLDWLWFLGYDLDSAVPDHSVLSKTRSRWGVEVFETVFARGVSQCVAAGLVNGRKIHLDGSLVDANASNNSICKGSEALIRQMREALRGEMSKLEEAEPTTAVPTEPIPERSGTKRYYRPKNRGMVSTTDPDAAVVRKNALPPRARYKHHRVVDDRCGVVTAVETTRGDVEENAKLMDLVEQHEQRTALKAETIVADQQYGTTDNFRACHERGLISHRADLSLSTVQNPARQEIFGMDRFVYDAATDTYRCPAGQRLTRRKHKHVRRAYEYACRAEVCRQCPMRDRCTRADGSARTIKRHENQEAIDVAKSQSHSFAAYRDRRRRKGRMEGSFADAATHHGFKRARWRRLWRQKIQDFLIVTVQNLRTLVRHSGPPCVKTAGAAVCFALWMVLIRALAEREKRRSSPLVRTSS